MQKQIKKFKKILILAIIFTLTGAVFYGSIFVHGQIDDSTNQTVDSLNKQIQAKRDQAEDLQKQQETIKAALQQQQAKTLDLTSQMAILDNQIAATQLQIESTQLSIDQNQLETKKINLQIIDEQDQIEKSKEHITVVLKLLYKNDMVSDLEILLMNNSFSEFMNQVKYLQDMNSDLSDSLATLQNLETELNIQKTALEQKNQELTKLNDELNTKKLNLDSQKQDKQDILVESQASEQQYQDLIQQLKQQQNQAAVDIVNMEKIVRQKLSKDQTKKLDANAGGFIWPVPKNRINTTFHDPDYPFRYLFEHPAWDIRAAQGTPILAAEAGYVAIAKDAGMGYSYIMIVHADGLATVYGHVSKILVKPDEYVAQGEEIGLSGATPGTPGAGPYTTGPHLHFEIRLNGIPVDPVSYMP